MNKKLLGLIIVLIVAAFGALAFFYQDQRAADNTVIVDENQPKQEEKEIEVAKTLAPQPGLPEAVEKKRQAIYQAALARDYDLLADEASENFQYSYGGSEEGLAEYLKMEDSNDNEKSFDISIKLLEMPYAKQYDMYTWPEVFTKASEDWTEKDIAQMRILLTEEEIEGYRQFGAYAYYRLGIMEDGKWVFYLAGD